LRDFAILYLDDLNSIKVYQTLLNPTEVGGLGLTTKSGFLVLRLVKMKSNRYFSVNEVAELLGISKQTLIRYEKKGIFPRPRRNPLNKWREYTVKEISHIKKIMGRQE